MSSLLTPRAGRQTRLRERVKRAVAASAAAGAALLLTAGLVSCASPEGPVPASYVTMASVEPQNPLYPANTTENGGTYVVSNIFRGLVTYDPSGGVHNAIARSIEPNADSTSFVITLKDGWTFHNGEKVTADSFINAWNFASDPANAQLGADFFSNIKGYEELNQRKATTLSGLTKLNDLAFRVDLSSPESIWPTRLGYHVYAPLPSVAFTDAEAFGEHPIGNGPYMMDDSTGSPWEHNIRIRLKAYPDYRGEDKARNDGISFEIYTSPDTAYADLLAGEIDSVGENVTPKALPTFKADFPNSHSDDPVAAIENLAIPLYIPHFGANEEGRLRRQAISLSINRPLITEKLFRSARIPAKDFGAPTLGGTPEIVGNDILTFNQMRAKQLWSQADAISPYGNTTFTLAYNSDGGHADWVEAVTNSIRQTLGINAEGKAYPNFKGMLDDLSRKALTGGVRSGWGGDFPSIANFLESMYTTNGSSNRLDYSNPTFDSLLTTALAQPSAAKAQPFFNEAQAILMQDLPQIPLWYKTAATAWNPDLKGFQTGWDGRVLLGRIEKPAVDSRD